MRERPTLTRFVVTDLLWWAAWFFLSFVVGWSITDQLASPLFWVIAGVLVLWRVLEWRGYDRSAPDGGHHDPELAARPDDRGHSETIRRSLIGFVGLALVGLVVANLAADPDVGEGRTLLLGEASLESSGYADWST
ncbi:MAG: hypothetical protein AAGG08_20370, partial [Actinomycetota bacterium]